MLLSVPYQKIARGTDCSNCR